MALTRSWQTETALGTSIEKPPVPVERRRELWWLVAASVFVAGALFLAAAAKTRDFAALNARLAEGRLLNLNSVRSPEEITPFLEMLPSGTREPTAQVMWKFIGGSRPIPNVGALARDGRFKGRSSGPALPVSKLKPLLIVRTPREFLVQFAIWIAAYFAAFYVVHLVWRWRRFQGDGSILPALHLLTGIGLTLAVSLRDPLRDTLELKKFAWGAATGCLLLLLPLLKAADYRRYATWIYTPLLASFGLFAMLIRFGSGPTGSDSKVNLGPFQPVEVIKILIVLFMAGYFARRWEWLRDLRERRLVPRWLQWMNLPRFSHVLPVACAVSCALLMFFLLKDLGPALVTGFLFLAVFGIARNRPGLAITGVVLLIAGVTAGYRLGTPHTVVDRINMWLSPWDNNVRGGDQLAHALWALSTGGPTGSGPGLGDPVMIPAGHTDLVLPAIGEEWGFCGVAAVALLFLFLCSRAYAIAKNAPDDYGVFLAAGFGTLIALEMLLISGGALGAIPLSGVASPFLSAGNTAMLANFFIFAVLLGISAHSRPNSPARPFLPGIRGLSAVVGALGFGLAGRAAAVQLMHADDLIARDTLVYQQDGVRRPQHNPRLNSLAHELTRGSIYDRNGVVLATSRPEELEHQRATLAKLNIAPEQTCGPQHSRCYPFGAVTRHLLGDWTTGENFHASNSSLIEHDQNSKLQGYSDLHDLAGYIRYRHRPGNRALQELLARDRSVRASIDIRLQLQAERILTEHLRGLHKEKGALVVMNARTGDVLAVASAPEPPVDGPSTTDQLLDRARYGEYPPGSTFKLVTALAALQSDPNSAHKRFHCAPLGDGRVGTRILGWNRAIRDDVGDHAHGSPDMGQAITVSCNAYFAQLGVFVAGAKGLKDMADKLDIAAGDAKEIKKMLPFAAYGQGPVLITPFKMARVAATIASGGEMPQGRWVVDDSNDRMEAPRRIVSRDQAAFVASAMRSVVTGGTGRRAMAGVHTTVAGKTGTAQVDEGEPHSWFTGFAPYNGSAADRISFAVVVEHGGYGSLAAAPIAKNVVDAAVDLGVIAGSSEK